MVSNFEQVKKLLHFEGEDDFYFAQIIKRKKEHPELGSNSHIVKTYYIISVKHLDSVQGEMICLAEYHNARVGINLNKRSFERTAFHTMKKVADQLMNKDYKSIRKSYNSVCGKYDNEKNKSWILDVDEDLVSPIMLAFVEYSCEPITKPVFDEAGMIINANSKVKAILRTKNGWHVITSPFRLDVFVKQYPDILVHKDNPTILYIP